MGIIPRRVAENFVITSDRDDTNSRRAPPRLLDTYLVWTGDAWSKAVDQGRRFETLEDAEDYLRVHMKEILS